MKKNFITQIRNKKVFSIILLALAILISGFLVLRSGKGVDETTKYKFPGPSPEAESIGLGFFKDGNKVWKHVENSISEKFLLIEVPSDVRPLSENYLGDSEYVYSTAGFYSDKDKVKIVQEADPNTFRELTDRYTLDRNNVYYRDRYHIDSIVVAAGPARNRSL
jgi:hypothetical protein